MLFFFSHRVLNCTVWAIFSEKSIKLLQSYLWENAEGGPKVRVWATEKFQFAIVILLKSSNERNILEKEIFWKKSNQMLTVLQPPSLFGTYETMWFCMCFLNQAGGEFPSGLCDSWTLCCFVWLVIKILGKLHGKSVLADSSHGLGSPGRSRSGFQSDFQWLPESHQRLWRSSLILTGFLQIAYEKAQSFKCSFPTTDFKTSTESIWRV